MYFAKIQPEWYFKKSPGETSNGRNGVTSISFVCFLTCHFTLAEVTATRTSACWWRRFTPRSRSNRWFGGTSILGNHHIQLDVCVSICLKQQQQQQLDVTWCKSVFWKIGGYIYNYIYIHITWLPTSGISHRRLETYQTYHLLVSLLGALGSPASYVLLFS